VEEREEREGGGEARESEPPPRQEPEPGSPVRGAIAGFLAWILPGAGHFFLGRRIRAIAFFLIVVTFFALGTGMEGRLCRPEAGKFLSYLCSFASLGLGPTYLGVLAAGGMKGDPTAVTWEYGNTFLLTAGIMNILLVLDTWDIATGRKK